LLEKGRIENAVELYEGLFKSTPQIPNVAGELVSRIMRELKDGLEKKSVIAFTTNLRKRGEVEKALDFAEKLFANSSTIEFQETLFWCLYDKAKRLTQARELSTVLLRMREIAKGLKKETVVRALNNIEAILCQIEKGGKSPLQYIAFITNLRKRGEVEKALELAEKLFAENPAMFQETLFWCLYDKTKRLTQEGELKLVLSRMRKLAQDSTKDIVINALASAENRRRQISSSFQTLNEAYENKTLAKSDYEKYGNAILDELATNIPIDDCEAREKLLYRYLDLNLPRTSPLHSKILSQALRFEYFSPFLFLFSEYFKRWGGADSFSESDWTRSSNQPPLVERVITAYTQEILIRKELLPESFFFELLDKAIKRWPKNKSLTIYKDLLLAKKQRIDEVKKQDSEENRFIQDALKSREIVEKLLKADKSGFLREVLKNRPFIEKLLQAGDPSFIFESLENREIVEKVLNVGDSDFILEALKGRALIKTFLASDNLSFIKATLGKRKLIEKFLDADNLDFLNKALEERQLIEEILSADNRDFVRECLKEHIFIKKALKNVDFIHEVLGESGFVRKALNAKGFIQDVLNNLVLFKNLKSSHMCKEIFVAWDSTPSAKDLKDVAEKLGFSGDRFKFVDYKKQKKTNPLSGNKYGLILAGPGPHSQPGKGKKSSALDCWEAKGFPHVIRLTKACGPLHVSVENFRKALLDAIKKGFIVPDKKLTEELLTK